MAIHVSTSHRRHSTLVRHIQVAVVAHHRAARSTARPMDSTAMFEESIFEMSKMNQISVGYENLNL